MMLLTKALQAKLPKLYATEGVKTEDKQPTVKFFDPCGRTTWFAVEGEFVEDLDTWQFFGYVVSPLCSDCDEWGYFTLSDLEGHRGRLGLPMERDQYCSDGGLQSELKRALEDKR